MVGVEGMSSSRRVKKKSRYLDDPFLPTHFSKKFNLNLEEGIVEAK